MSHAYPNEHSTILFRGQYVWRTGDAALAMAIPLLASVVFVCVAASVYSQGTDSLAVLVGGGFSVGAMVWGGLGLFCLRKVIAGRVDRVEIRTDGILCRQRFTPWNDVRSFYGIQYGNGIMLKYDPNRFMWGDGSLPTTPPLTDQEYRDLAQTLAKLIGETFPRVDVCPQPRSGKGSE
jgi:hypothetical protein